MRFLLVASTLLLAGLAGCLNDDTVPADDGGAEDAGADGMMAGNHTPITAFGVTRTFELPGGGQGIWIDDGILYATNGGDLHIVDVSDPMEPALLGELLDVGARDVDILHWHNATYAVLAGSGLGMHVIDVSDPTTPTLVTTAVLPSAGVHNVAALPGTPYVYSSGASGTTKRIDVLDITDPTNPTVHTFPIPATMNGIPVESDGCHDITVRPDLERAYCAGGGGTYTGLGGETFIWDISEAAGGPTNPTWVSMMDDARIKYHHQAFVNETGELLIVNDEFIAPNCARAETPLPGAYDPQVPTGAAWVYDVSDEANPVLRSFVQNPAMTSGGDGGPTPAVNCGSHFGDAIPGENKFVMGWYQGGTMLVSYEDPDNPEILDVLGADGSTWDSRVANGHVFHSSGDLQVTPFA